MANQSPLCIFCSRPVERLHLHHLVPKSEGGTVTAPACDTCHRRHHSTNGDFQRWGQIGGRISAAMGCWAWNLKLGQSAPDPMRRGLPIC